MSIRSKYTTVNTATQGVGGNCNLGIVIVRHIRTGTLCVEKRIPPEAIASGDAATEARVMQRCNQHPNIVTIYGLDYKYDRTGYGSLFMQHAELGSLDALISRYIYRGARLPDEGFVWKVLYNCALGLASLQTGRDAHAVRGYAAEYREVSVKSGWDPIVHRDLKPSNIFMTWQDQASTSRYPTVLLGDFGCSMFGSEIRAGRRPPATDAMFLGPEFPRFSDRSDVYALGLVVLCLAGRSPQTLPNWEVMRGTSKPLYRVVKAMLRHNPSERPSVAELPAVVWKGYREWLKEWKDGGAVLPSWAFGQ